VIFLWGDIKVEGINVRTDLNTPNSQKNLAELAENIKINGLMQPIVLKGIYGTPPYEIIVGKRRFMAHQLLGEETIKATFSGEIDEIHALLLSLSENLFRQDLNYTDTAEAITTLYKNFDKDEYEVKKRTGISIRTIRNYIKIEEQATPKIKSLLSEKKISMTDAKRAIDAAQGENEKADQLIDEIVKMTKYEKKRVVEIGSKNKDATASEIIEDAQKPKLEETVILNLPLNVHEALMKAAEELSLDPEMITMDVLKTWLKTNDYLTE